MSSDSSASTGSGKIRLWDSSHDEHDSIGMRSLGFWLYMLSDAMIFAGLFAAHGVYTKAFAGSFTADQVVHPWEAVPPTLLIFASVLAYGFAMVSLKLNHRTRLLRWMGLSFVLGVAFIGVEWWEFTDLAAQGALPTKSAFLSDYWVIVIIHALHVFFGLIWMLVMLAQVALAKNFDEHLVGRLLNLRIFWFFQAIIWVVVFTFVYLMGAS